MQTLCQSDQAAYLALQGSFHEISNLLTLNISNTRRISSPLKVCLNLTRVRSSGRDDPDNSLPLCVLEANPKSKPRSR